MKKGQLGQQMATASDFSGIGCVVFSDLLQSFQVMQLQKSDSAKLSQELRAHQAGGEWESAQLLGPVISTYFSKHPKPSGEMTRVHSSEPQYTPTTPT